MNELLLIILIIIDLIYFSFIIWASYEAVWKEIEIPLSSTLWDAWNEYEYLEWRRKNE